MTSRIFVARRNSIILLNYSCHMLNTACMLNLTKHTAGMNDGDVRMEGSNIYLP